MIHIRNTLIGICVATASLGALAQGTEEHKEHHEPPRLSWRPFGLSQATTAVACLASCR